MTVLAIDTTTSDCTIAVDRSGKRRVKRLSGHPHSETLLPTIADLLGEIHPDLIVVATGPGSYTGTRAGVAIANALAWAWDIPVVGVGTHKAKTIEAIIALARKEKRPPRKKVAIPIYQAG
jgi:tRNA threonylcarbamoyladenosine biosynthesis protein TsaB